MLTANVNLEDRLVKCQLGTKKHIQKDNNNKLTKTYVKYDSFQTIVKRKIHLLSKIYNSQLKGYK